MLFRSDESDRLIGVSRFRVDALYSTLDRPYYAVGIETVAEGGRAVVKDFRDIAKEKAFEREPRFHNVDGAGFFFDAVARAAASASALRKAREDCSVYYDGRGIVKPGSEVVRPFDQRTSFGSYVIAHADIGCIEGASASLPSSSSAGPAMSESWKATAAQLDRQ